MESDCACEQCRPGEGSRLRCNILCDQGKPTVQVGFTVSAPAVACEVAHFTSEVIIPEAEVKVEYRGQTCRLPLLVMPGKRPALLRRNWFSDLCLNRCTR